MFVIGLTGSFATGKSTVAGFFKDLGAKVLNADQIAHQQMRRGGNCVEKIIKVFGPMVKKNGGIDRKKLARIVFTDKKKLRQLEKMIHPVVKKVIFSQLAKWKKEKKNHIVVLEVPLLFEAGWHKWTNLNIVVKATRDVQLRRAMRRHRLSKQEAQMRIKQQMSLTEKIRLADIIINNSGRKYQTKKQVEGIWQNL